MAHPCHPDFALVWHQHCWGILVLLPHLVCPASVSLCIFVFRLSPHCIQLFQLLVGGLQKLSVCDPAHTPQQHWVTLHWPSFEEVDTELSWFIPKNVWVWFGSSTQLETHAILCWKTSYIMLLQITDATCDCLLKVGWPRTSSNWMTKPPCS